MTWWRERKYEERRKRVVSACARVRENFMSELFIYIFTELTRLRPQSADTITYLAPGMASVIKSWRSKVKSSGA